MISFGIESGNVYLHFDEQDNEEIIGRLVHWGDEYQFDPNFLFPQYSYRSEELRAIADKLDELNKENKA